MNNETNFKDITRGRTKQLPTDENEVAQFKQHWIRNQIGNPVIREIFRSSAHVYHKDRPESMKFVLLSKLPPNSEVCTIHVVSVSFQ